MSTKIYNAYRVNMLTVARLRDFVNELSGLYYGYLKDMYCRLLAGCVAECCEFLPYLKNNNIEDHDGKIKELARVLAYPKEKRGDLPSYEDASYKLSEYGTIGGIAKDYALGMMSGADDCFGTPCVAKLGIYAEPKGKPYCLIMAFGGTFQTFMAMLAAGAGLSGFGKFRNKWRIMDWHYQNSTDRPENIPEQEWKQRGKDWDDVMITSVPRDESVIVQLYDFDRFRSRLSADEFDGFTGGKVAEAAAGHLYRNMKGRLGKYAEALASDEYISIHEKDTKDDEDYVHLISRLDRQFRQLAKAYRGNSAVSNGASELIVKYEKAVRPWMRNFDADGLAEAMNECLDDVDAYV